MQDMKKMDSEPNTDVDTSFDSSSENGSVHFDDSTLSGGGMEIVGGGESDSDATSDIYDEQEGQEGQGGQGGQGKEKEKKRQREDVDVEEEGEGVVSFESSVDEDDENYDDDDDDDNDDDDDDDENHLQKFDNELKKNYIASFHPESLSYNNEETEFMSRVTRNDAGTIIDPYHKTLPFLTKYEKTRVLGIRTKQLNEGAKPYVDVNPTIIDGYIIAQLELEHKKLPFIIRRPLPNGSSELWRLQDLEIIC
jgi:DNA-directed RNA polymerase I, II, and III subunit RPABC2